MQGRTAIAIIAGCSGLFACGGEGNRAAAERDTAAAQPAPSTSPSSDSVVAPVRNAAGRELGTLTLTPRGEGIALDGQLAGLPPGEHAIHVHAVGRCDDPKFESAGDHWNPTNREHGTANPEGPHLGDLPNLTVAVDSSVAVQATTPGGAISDAPGLLDTDGAAVVVHAKPDDHKTQPSGGSGERIACGVATAAPR